MSQTDQSGGTNTVWLTQDAYDKLKAELAGAEAEKAEPPVPEQETGGPEEAEAQPV